MFLYEIITVFDFAMKDITIHLFLDKWTLSQVKRDLGQVKLSKSQHSFMKSKSMLIILENLNDSLS